jgi:O-antigen ligase
VSELALAPGRRHGPARRVKPTALAGTAAVALSVAATKWGSYLGVPPIYPIDVLLALATAAVLLAAAGPRHRARPAAAAGRAWPGPTAAVLFGYVLLRLLAGPEHDLAALRDFAPYGYLGVAFLAAYSYQRSTLDSRMRTAPLLDPSQGLRLFELRASTDATIVGVTAALHLMRFLRGGRPWHLLVGLAGLAVVLVTPARAAVLGVAAALAIALVCYYAAPGPRARRGKLLLTGALPALLVLAALSLPLTPVGSKLLSGFGLAPVRSDVDKEGIGTVRGRNVAWRLVDQYVADSGHARLGVGFGPDFLGDSGARLPLGGYDALRSPHNYFIGTYARLGLLGLALLLVLLVAAVRAGAGCVRLAADEPLLLFAVLLPAALLVCGAFGVELEAPFGAVPFFWCLGIVLSRPQAGAAAAP